MEDPYIPTPIQEFLEREVTGGRLCNSYTHTPLIGEETIYVIESPVQEESLLEQKVTPLLNKPSD